MVRKSGLLILLTVLGALREGSRARAQAPEMAPPPSPLPVAGAQAPDLLPGFPRPPDAPASLWQPAPPAPPYGCAPLPGPYFEPDPRLDPPPLPQPGWFAAVELAIVGPHVKNRLTEMVQVGGAAPDTVHLPAAELNWTVSPRFDLGYRLPSGFGGFGVAYQTLATDGKTIIPGPDAPALLKSRLDVNVADLDYQSWEMSLWPHWGMKWWFGLRLANIFFDSQASEDFAAADAGSGIFATHVTNRFLGIGPHYGLELARHWDGTGLALTARADGATLLGRVHQDFLEFSTSPGPTGSLLFGETRRSNPQDVPMLNVFAGLTWEPRRYPDLCLSVGYQIEYWWNAGRLSTGASRGEWGDQGIVVRAGLNF